MDSKFRNSLQLMEVLFTVYVEMSMLRSGVATAKEAGMNHGKRCKSPTFISVLKLAGINIPNGLKHGQALTK